MFIWPCLISQKIQLTARAFATVTEQKVWPYFSEESLTPSLTQDFHKTLVWLELSGIKTRLPIYYAAGFLVLLGLLPKFGALAQIIPSPVLGGAMLVMFGFVSIQGMQILARVDFANNEHNFLIAAVSIAAGVGLNNSNLFVSMPTAFQMFFSNGIVVASLLAIVLNAVLNHKRNKKRGASLFFFIVNEQLL